MTIKAVTIGAGQAAVAFAAKLRELDAEAEILMIGGEESLPYQRPPLSKKYMTGEMEAERLLLRPAEWYADNRIECRTSTQVTRIDPATKKVHAGGEAISFDKLLIATGAAPRALPAAIGGELDNVFTLRSLADADRIASLMQEGAKALVIGGGYIGLEAAAVFATRGLKVRAIEMADRILKRVASAETAGFVRSVHEAHGVDVLENTAIERLEGNGGAVSRAVLGDGSSIDADLVVVGIGVTPNDILAREAGLVCGNGIEVDEFTRTSHPDIHAAGDVACFEFHGSRTRLESVQNAIEQAEHAAKVIAGSSEPYVPVPWFWSDQYDMKLQIAGLNAGFDNTVVRPGSHEGGQSVWYFAGETFLAVDAINDPRAYMFGKKILEMGRTVTPRQAADADFDLKALIKP
ncbi:MAG: FAD-dependent oxidoreductase [Phyllobacteriaceae bacterium]|nr:FAD-dependent oxidoreductase [Phyllobacteriaceae bacterium]